MATVNWQDESELSRYYGIWDQKPGSPTQGQIIEGYSRHIAQQSMPHPVYGFVYPPDATPHRHTQIAEKLVAILAPAPTDRIFIAGCGAGWTIEALLDMGYSNTYGFDFSAPILTDRASDIRADVAARIVNMDMRAGFGGQVRNKIRQVCAGSNEFNWVVSEYLLESFSDSELSNYLPLLSVLLLPGVTEDHIAHLVYEHWSGFSEEPLIQEPQYDWRTIEEYDALYAPHRYISGNDWEVV